MPSNRPERAIATRVRAAPREPQSGIRLIWRGVSTVACSGAARVAEFLPREPPTVSPERVGAVLHAIPDRVFTGGGAGSKLLPARRRGAAIGPSTRPSCSALGSYCRAAGRLRRTRSRPAISAGRKAFGRRAGLRPRAAGTGICAVSRPGQADAAPVRQALEGSPGAGLSTAPVAIQSQSRSRHAQKPGVSYLCRSMLVSRSRPRGGSAEGDSNHGTRPAPKRNQIHFRIDRRAAARAGCPPGAEPNAAARGVDPANHGGSPAHRDVQGGNLRRGDVRLRQLRRGPRDPDPGDAPGVRAESFRTHHPARRRDPRGGRHRAAAARRAGTLAVLPSTTPTPGC